MFLSANRGRSPPPGRAPMRRLPWEWPWQPAKRPRCGGRHCSWWTAGVNSDAGDIDL